MSATFQPGDPVICVQGGTVPDGTRGVVLGEADSGGYDVRWDPPYDTRWTHPNQMEHARKPKAQTFRVGDKVIHQKDGAEIGTIVRLNEDGHSCAVRWPVWRGGCVGPDAKFCHLTLVQEPRKIDGILAEVSDERDRQDAKWGGPEHDDQHSPIEFVKIIEDYAGWARAMFSQGSPDKGRRRLVQVAALALAAVESLDRKEPKP